jgi:hypothetical protein
MNMTRSGVVSLLAGGAPTREQRWAAERAAERRRNVVVPCMRGHRAHWAVVQRKGNASAFNGYHWQDSDYSQVICQAPGCQRGSWRTRAAYVDQLPDLPHHPPLRSPR